VPIGCERDRFRSVDAEARAFVGERRSSVFQTPPIEVFRESTYEQACALLQHVDGSERSI
jgi:predicted RNase H-like nuclease